ncbi:MAG: TIGR00159 family protein [Candidatus Eisenbacteria bacterium]|uniref:Diadenylate cyclase n=1 Tax=Eiseniibacteriota bacterium TaxID=2212470 RepID=A0A7Y2E7U7_UNCEI|nr:TIGR00159 family protein [Candidatus Eisenbacteria bacterium]
MLDFLRNYWRDILDVLILSSIFYYLFRFIRGTRAAQMFVGLLIILLLSLAAGALQLNGLNWLVSSLRTVWVLAFLILFQPELRKALTSLGGGRIFSSFTKGEDTSILGELVRATENMAAKGLGALIVVERNVGLKNICETGTPLEAQVTPELLGTIFTPPSPLHDGAVVISGNQIVAAGCILPLTQNQHLVHSLGTRHRAALGMSEESDAFVIVVSEETRKISIAEGGRLVRNLDAGSLRSNLVTLFSKDTEAKGRSESEEATART